MDIKMRRALTEVNEILKYTDYSVLEKIPQKFFEFVKQNMDTEFIPNVIPGEELMSQPISMEAKELLGLMYRDFLTTKEEREKLVERDEQVLKDINKEIELTDMAKKDDEQAIKPEINHDENGTGTALIKFEEKWYKRLWSKLKNVVKKK